MTPLAHLDALERALETQGFPAMTPWWQETLARFYDSGRRQLVIRAGRRAGKSSSLCRIGVLEALYGAHPIAPGDVGVVAIVSVNRDEAAQRLRTVKAILDALRVGWRPVEGGLELIERPIAFKVYAATIAGVAGFSCICAICDEVAKWRDTDTGANPATEVIASLRPTLAGQPYARLFLSSSPMGKLDAHASAFDRGETTLQCTACAPTWVARPTLTEAMCRELEPDEATLLREYGAVPFDGSAASLFTESMLLRVTRKHPLKLSAELGATYVAATDPATRGNAWTLAVGRDVEMPGGAVGVQVAYVREWRPPRGGALDSEATFASMALELGEYGPPCVWQDQWSYDANRAIAERHGVDLRQAPATQTSKVQVFENLRRRVVDGAIELPDVPQLRADLCGVRKWVGKGGTFTIELERVGSRHADYAPAIALLADKLATDSTAPDWMRACQRYRQVFAPIPVEPEPIRLEYGTRADGRTLVSGWRDKRCVGEMYFTPRDPSSLSFLFGSQDEFRELALADAQARGLLTERNDQP